MTGEIGDPDVGPYGLMGPVRGGFFEARRLSARFSRHRKGTSQTNDENLRGAWQVLTIEF
jgi:hypothetical protein